MKDVSKLSLIEIIILVEIYSQTGEVQWHGDILERIAELWSEWNEGASNVEETITQLRDRIKYSKNPMGIKKLIEKLDALY